MKLHLKQYSLLFFLLFMISGFSQKCQELENWMNVIKNEYPNMRMGTSMRRGVVENMAVNLYSDSYFIPFGGKSFTTMSQNARAKDWRKIQTCYLKGNYRSDPHSNFVFSNLIYNYYPNFANTAFITQIEQRNTLRKSFEDRIAVLKRGNLSPNDIQAFKQQLATTYAVLFPSELSAAREELIKQESISANKQLTTEFEQFENVSPEYPSLDRLLNFKSKNTVLLEQLDSAKQQEWNSQIDAKLVSILATLMPKELKAADNIPTTNIASINALLANFKNKYRRVMAYEPVQATFNGLKAKKTTIVAGIMPTVTKEIDSTKDQKELNLLSERFLTDLDDNGAAQKQLTAQIEQRRRFLANEKKRLAQEALERKKQERMTMLTSSGKEEGNMELKTKDMFYAEFFDYLYRGHTENLTIERESEEFLMIFNAYATGFSKNCQAALPENKIQLMEWACASYTVTSEALSGMELYRSCNSWYERETGIFVKPEVFEAKAILEASFNQSVLAYVMDMYTNPDAMGNSVEQIHRTKRLQNDIRLFFTNNDCTGAAMEQFENNLLNYANDQALVRLKGISEYEEMRMQGAPTGKQNITKLINDIVEQQSSTWAMNKYVSGSITNLQSFKGQDGKTVVAYRANYQFKNPILGGDTGMVTVRLKEGLPDCVLFSDYPNTCKKPSASLLMAYSSGKYGL